jgi:hypothetical protein
MVRQGARGALAVWCLFVAACSYTPAAQERARTEQTLRGLQSVVNVTVGCEATVFANDGLCADVTFNDDLSIKFERVGVNSFGSKAAHVIVAEASGLVPRVASCDGVGPPNFHRDAPLGHHFHPPLISLQNAVLRYHEVLEEVEFWPQCPQYWEMQDHRGVNYRYCSRASGNAAEPPAPERCP